VPGIGISGPTVECDETTGKGYSRRNSKMFFQKPMNRPLLEAILKSWNFCMKIDQTNIITTRT